jgi:mRNA-degrading endonuclease toxin of MazEF toxin-antitoxin module
MAGKTRPVIVLLADNLAAPRTLIIRMPVTRQSRGSDLEIPLGHVSFLDPDSVANVQAIGALPHVRFEKCNLRSGLARLAYHPQVPRTFHPPRRRS